MTTNMGFPNTPPTVPPTASSNMPVPSAHPAIGLRQMKAGAKGRIVSVDAEGELGRRIRDMGLLPGADVEVMGHAPLRDPIALRLCGVTLALRNREADFITVEVK